MDYETTTCKYLQRESLFFLEYGKALQRYKQIAKYTTIIREMIK